MKKRLKVFLIISLLFSTLIISCKKEGTANPTASVDKNLPQQQIYSANIVETEKDKKVRTITANHLDNYPEKKLIIADTVLVTDYNPDQSVKSTLKCDKAEIDQKRDIFTCTGNVIVTTKNGILKTPFLIWNQKDNKITAKDGIELKRPDNTLLGETLETDSNLKKIKITKVSAKGKLEQKDLKW